MIGAFGGASAGRGRMRPGVTIASSALGALDNNLPGTGWTLVTDQNFNSIDLAELQALPATTGSNWAVSTNRQGEDPTIVADATAPSGDGLVFRQNYEGVNDGFEPKFPNSGLGGGLAVYIGFYVKFLNTWTNPTTGGIKWHIVNAMQGGESQSAGWLGMGRAYDLGTDQFEPSHGWVFNGTCDEMDATCGTDEGGGVRFYTAPTPAAAGLMTRGEWHKVQYYLSKGGAGTTGLGIVRVWIDDVLIIDRTGFTWVDEAGTWQSFAMGATWGGGNTPSVGPEGNIIYYDRCVIYSR